MLFHTTREYDAQFMVRSVLQLRLVPQLIIDGFFYSLNSMSMSLKSTPKSLDLTCKKRYCPHFFNMAKNLYYMGPYLEPKSCGAYFMSGGERALFLAWCD